MTNFKPNQTAQSALFIRVSPENLREAALRLEAAAQNCLPGHSVTLTLAQGLELYYEPPRGVSGHYVIGPYSPGESPDDLS